MDILSEFGVQPILLIAQIVNFFILFYLLKRFLYKPILTVLEKRKEKIAQSLEQAEAIEKRLEEITKSREKVYSDALKEAKNILDEASKTAEQMLGEASKKAKDSASKIMEEAKANLKIEQEKMRQEVKESLAEIVALSLEKVTGKVLSQKEQKELLSKSLGEVRNL